MNVGGHEVDLGGIFLEVIAAALPVFAFLDRLLTGLWVAFAAGAVLFAAGVAGIVRSRRGVKSVSSDV